MGSEKITRSMVERKYVETILVDTQKEIIKIGYDEVVEKIKVANGIEPHPEKIDTDEKPN